MLAITTKRPRNVDAPRAAAILYGDWGTSKAYVIGLAFAVGGYSSFWLIAAMCLLTALVGVNYMAICRHYPDGGGVYASVRHRSEIVSIVGAFLLIADYIVTAAISALSAFLYLSFLGVHHAEYWAAAAIVLIGSLNYFGPKHTGGLAFLVSVPTVVVVVLLAAFSVPHLAQAWHNVQPLTGGFFKNWNGFVGVVLALSGVEAIANATGVMKLNPGSTADKPNVSKTSTPAIFWVMMEVCIFTALLGLAMHALPNLVIDHGDVDAKAMGTMPENPGVRDYMLRYMGQVFVGHSLGPAAGAIAGLAVSVVFGLLLLSAVNTAIVDLIAISFLMSRDGELPQGFQKLNRFGVPTLGIYVATLIPAILVIAVKDMGGLADLYAVGVVGAIATNLGASSTDKKLDLVRWERILMFSTFFIMLAIELSLFVVKPTARYFSFTVLAVGLILRGLAAESSARKKKKDAQSGTDTAFINKNDIIVPQPTAGIADSLTGAPVMCAVRGIGRTLDFAIEEAKELHRPLYVLFVRSQAVITEADTKRKWQTDADARTIFAHAFEKAAGHPVLPCYTVSDAPADTIVDLAATTGASHLILGAPTRRGLASLLSGDVVSKVSRILPEEIHLLIYA
jgi:amino acid transporter/nucleotide-binding universal stress UspA family protein